MYASANSEKGRRSSSAVAGIAAPRRRTQPAEAVAGKNDTAALLHYRRRGGRHPAAGAREHLKMSGFVVVDWPKRGRSPTVVKSVAGALIVVLSSSLRTSSRSKKGLLTPTAAAASRPPTIRSSLASTSSKPISWISFFLLCDFVLLFISLICISEYFVCKLLWRLCFFSLYYPLHVPYV